MKTILFSFLTLLIILSILSSIGFTEYEPITQIALPEGAKARLGKGEVKEITFSPNGNFLAIASENTDQTFTIAFSPDGNTLATGSIGGQVYLWDMKTRKQKKILSGHTGNVLDVTFSPDGKTLASGSTDGTILLFGPVWKE